MGKLRLRVGEASRCELGKQLEDWEDGSLISPG